MLKYLIYFFLLIHASLYAGNIKIAVINDTIPNKISPAKILLGIILKARIINGADNKAANTKLLFVANGSFSITDTTANHVKNKNIRIPIINNKSNIINIVC